MMERVILALGIVGGLYLSACSSLDISAPDSMSKTSYTYSEKALRGCIWGWVMKIDSSAVTGATVKVYKYVPFSDQEKVLIGTAITNSEGFFKIYYERTPFNPNDEDIYFETTMGRFSGYSYAVDAVMSDSVPCGEGMFAVAYDTVFLFKDGGIIIW